MTALLLRLGSPLQPLADPGHVIDLANQDSIDDVYTKPVHDWDEFELASGSDGAVLLPVSRCGWGPAFAAAIASLSHLARVGLAVHVTSPWVMPGWDGHLTLELLNQRPATLRLRRDMPVARAVMWQMDGVSQNPVPHARYGRPGHLGSRYADEFGSELDRWTREGVSDTVDCAFCAEFGAFPSSGQGSRIICEDSGWVLLPTVGCFTLGYCLFMPLDHIDAVADAAPGELASVGAAVEKMRDLISGSDGAGDHRRARAARLRAGRRLLQPRPPAPDPST